MSWRTRLKELGIELPGVAAPLAAYVPAVRSGSHVYTSGQLPFVAGALPATGKVGGDIGPDEAKGYARTCALNALAAVDALVGLDSITRVVKVVGFVATWSAWTRSPGWSRWWASSPPPRASPVSRPWSTARPRRWVRSSARPACTPVPPLGWPNCHSAHPSRWS